MYGVRHSIVKISNYQLPILHFTFTIYVYFLLHNYVFISLFTSGTLNYPKKNWGFSPQS